ncbi:MAG TPA: sigma-70 family RNA polymerase sigma factor [Nannocystis sp.]|jgi:RNA polymerase sigma-70 factor (ECF subfamily)
MWVAFAPDRLAWDRDHVALVGQSQPGEFVRLPAAMVIRGDDTDEAAVLRAAQRGEQTAQAVLFSRYRDQVARQILRMIGNSASVDDLVQEVFIRTFTALPQFRSDAKLSTWLYTIALNRVRNWWDSQRRRQRREAVATSLPPTEPDEDPEERLETKEHLARLYAALGVLPDKLREAFVARAIEGMTLLEASQALGRPISTVSYHTRRAEQALCEALGIAYIDK